MTALTPIPEDFLGGLIEVSVETGVLTMPLYKGIPKASITCLDCSANIMKNAENRAEAMNRYFG